MVKVGGAMTFRVAEAAFPVPPFIELTLPVAFVFAPSEVPLTSTLTVQVVFAPTLPPDKLMRFVFCAAVTVPPHELIKLFGVLMIKPAGSVSLKDNPFSEAAFGLVIV